MAALPLGHASRAALGVGKRIGGAPAEAVAAELQARTAEQVFKVLGELKGGAMKVGQAMSIFEAALPEDVAAPYRATLTRLQDSAPALPAGQVHAVLADNFGPRWRRKLSAFDDEPAAAASIGQVHRAVWRDGREVAVKIQYPGADKALMADLRNASRLARMMTSWVPGVDVKPILDELAERVMEELDYAQEAASQRAFAAAFRDDPEVAIPDVLAAGHTVIVSEWLDGVPLSRIIAEGSREERNAAGQHYQRFLLSGPARAGLLHADPHPGNFRITPDGRFGVLDFGAVAHLPDGLPPMVGNLLRIAMTGDAEAVLAGLREEGFVKAGSRIEAQGLLDFLDPFVEPARTETFHYNRAWLRSQFTRLNDPRNPDFAIGMRLNLPPSYLLIHRVWLGGIGVLCQLDAEVAMRAELDRWVPGFADPAVGSQDAPQDAAQDASE
jgi:predicted unusual protein kinase regulating ubiquinone biosynthesis (AarF/ABC1/UbiB family)